MKTKRSTQMRIYSRKNDRIGRKRKMTQGERVKKIRKEQNLSQEKFGNRLGFQARILGNSITEMKAFYRTCDCKL